MKLNDAIRRLRGNESQQIFATKMGISMGSLQNYERQSNPRRPMMSLLIALAELAQERGEHHLANTFLQAFLEDSALGKKFRFFGWREEPNTPPSQFLLWPTTPESDKRERNAAWNIHWAVAFAHSKDRDLGLRALEAASEAIERVFRETAPSPGEDDKEIVK